MPVPLALPLGLAAGAALAWLGAGGGLRGSDDRSGPRAAAYVGALVLGPAAAHLELVAGAWADLYLADLPSALDLVLVVAVGASPSVGAHLARRGLARGDVRWALGLAATGAVATIGGAVAFADRIGVVASFSAFRRDLGGDALLDHRAGAALLGAAVAFAIALVLAVRAVAPRALTNRPGSHTLRS